VGVISVAGLFVLHADAQHVYDGLTSRALPFVVLTVLCGILSCFSLTREAARGARLFSVAAVAGLIASWGVAQWPYLLPTSLTVSAAASPDGTLEAVIAAVVLAALIVLPGFVLLYVLDQRDLLPEEGVEDVADPARTPVTG
jgi:cytochrome d ubiquinol oxidase subunit II